MDEQLPEPEAPLRVQLVKPKKPLWQQLLIAVLIFLGAVVGLALIGLLLLFVACLGGTGF